MTDAAWVLGGGGVLGGAWAIGLPAGLAEAGIDLSRADTLIGTSAGSAAPRRPPVRSPNPPCARRSPSCWVAYGTGPPAGTCG
ncbi:hypothetical protein [Streptomyces goshikiensis]|uniref:hypothetical protein n=1 Tax=Streptomyces goshikiensis TaxID=1942 RepID=UPI0037117002